MQYNEMNVGGKVLWKYAEGEVGLEDVFGRAMGFSSQELEDVYNTALDQSRRTKTVKEKAKVAAELVGRLFRAVDDQEEDGVRIAQLALNVVMNDIRNGKDRNDVMNAITKELNQSDFRGRTYQRWIEDYNSDLLSAQGRMFIYGQTKLQEDTK